MSTDPLSLLIEREGSASAAARAIGVSPQRVHLWQRDGLPDDGHLRCWLALNSPRTLKRWLAVKPRPAELAA